jgi:eukaryotic-like serine/threonine-protein kinase
MCPADPWVRIRLPRGEWFYDPVRPLGRPGGFGEVFEGKDQAGKPVAVKRLKVTAGEAAHRELKIADELAGKSFEHVVAVLDSGEDSEGGAYFVVMPRAERSLADELTARGMPPSPEAIDILRQIAKGLKEVEGLIQRDLKPGNVLYHDGRWKITDFGIARFVEDATSVNTVRGFLSAPYAAPEQWKGEHATHATDVYALSCLAYVLLRGEPPFPGPTRTDFQRQHTSGDPPVLTSADARLRAIFSAGLRKPQSGRPPIDRVIAVLSEVFTNPAPSTPAMAALQGVNAIEAERVSAAAAEAERERRKNAERNALIDTGENILLAIIARLKDLARQNAPEARIHAPQPGKLEIAMGQAQLAIELQGGTPPNALFPNAKWNALAIGQVQVRQGAPHEWSHGATLWYMELRTHPGYRWYEVAYRRHALSGGPLVGPFQIQNLGNDIYGEADRAAGPGMHTIEVESGPTPIDDENEESFFARWLTRLAQAYGGRLCPF